MQQDTTQVMAVASEKMQQSMQVENTSAAKDKVKYGFTTFLESLSKVLVVEAEDLEKVVPHDKSDPVFDRAKARLHAVQLDPGTYYNEPSGKPEHFQDWVKNFIIDDHKGDISELLVSKVEVRALYTKLVPSEISHADFWQRYFYKVHQLQLDEARKLALMKRAEQAEKKEDSIGWEDDWSGDEDNAESRERLKGEPLKNSQKSTSDRTTEETVLDRLKPADVNDISGQGNKSESDDKKDTNVLTEKQTDADIVDDSLPVKIKSEKTETAEQINQDPVNNVVEERTETTIQQANTDTSLSDDSDKTVDQCIQQENNDTSASDNSDKTVEQSIQQENNDTSASDDSDKTVEQCTQHTDEPTVNSESKSEELDIKMKVKDDVVVVNPDRDTPSSESSEKKESEITDDDWEQDFDVELTEEDMKAADEIAKKLNLSAKDYTNLASDIGDDWESWE